MMRYADPTRCPDCFGPLAERATSCPTCGLPLVGVHATALFAAFQQADRALDALRQQRYRRPASVVGASGAGVGQPATVQPAAAVPPRAGLSTASVPQILLGLGALCLLVAAVVFLAVAWEWLGVGGRTVVLLVFTIAATAAAVWARRHDLRIAMEAISSVALGLLALDVAGAGHAGWLGERSDASMSLIIGSVLAVAGVTTAWLTRGTSRWDALVSATAAAGLGASAAVSGAATVSEHPAACFFVAGLAFAAVAFWAREQRVGILEYVAGGSLGLWMLPLIGLGLSRSLGHDTVAGLWRDQAAWPLVGAALLAGLVGVVWRGIEIVSIAVAGILVSLVVVLPALDNGIDPAILALLLVALPWAAAGLPGLPSSVRWASPVPLAAALGAPVAEAARLVVESFHRMVPLDSTSAWTLDAGRSLPPMATGDGHPALLLGTAVVVAGALVVRWRRTWPWAASATAVVGAVDLGLWGVPAAVPFAVLLGLAVAAAVVGMVRPALDLEGTLTGLALGALALFVSAPSSVLTLVAAAVLAVVAAVASWRVTGTAGDVAAGAAPPLVGLALWAAGEVATLDVSWRPAVIAVALAAVVLPRTRPSEEMAALVTVGVAGIASVGDGVDATAVAVGLTAAGVAVVAHSLLHPTRRGAAWLGGALLAAASWVRLWDTGVRVVEAYTLPSALVLVALGLWALRRHPDWGTQRALSAGLWLACVPSLLRTFGDDAVSLRALLLGLACLGLILGGVARRWGAPLVVGATVGLVLVLRECGPYAATLPPWLFIATSGLLLTFVGVTWERRLAEARRGAAYLARLR